MTSPRRGRLIAGSLAIVAAVAVFAAVVAVALVAPWDRAEPAAAPTPAASPEPAPPPVLAALSAGGGAPDPDLVRAAVHDLLVDSGLGNRVGAAVLDVATGASLYGFEPEATLVPASTIKLVTAAAVLAARGPSYEIPTTVVAGAEPGEVVLVGGGDPTLARDAGGFYPGAARLDDLAEQVLAALDGAEVTSVTVDATRFEGAVYGPWSEDIPTGGFVGPITALMTDGARVDPDEAQVGRAAARFNDPAVAAGEAFADLLGLGPADVAKGEAPAGAVVLGEVASPPLLRLVELMLVTSDNVVAEALARQVALARGEPASFAGAAAATADVLAGELGLSLGDAVIADGSGLSRGNRLSARLLTDLVAAAAGADQPALAGVVAGLPVAGWSGTLADRHEDPSAEVAPGIGVVRAKTGSLNGVDALAGVVTTTDGRLLAFAVIADEVPIGRPASWVALDRIPAALARM